MHRLDLEDFGAIVAEQLRAERAGQITGQIDYLDSAQRRMADS